MIFQWQVFWEFSQTVAWQWILWKMRNFVKSPGDSMRTFTIFFPVIWKFWRSCVTNFRFKYMNLNAWTEVLVAFLPFSSGLIVSFIHHLCSLVYSSLLLLLQSSSACLSIEFKLHAEEQELWFVNWTSLNTYGSCNWSYHLFATHTHSYANSHCYDKQRCYLLLFLCKVTNWVIQVI